MAYERVAGPLGGRRIDVAAAVIAAVVANANRDPKSRAIDAEDFLVDWDAQSVAPMTPDDMWAQIRQTHKAITAASR